MLFQMRHGFYLVYLIFSVIYIAILKSIPGEFSAVAHPLIILSDPSVLGVTFIGGLLLLEKRERTLQSLFVTPLTVDEYFIAKITSLTLLALVASFTITLVVRGLAFNPMPLFLAVFFSSVFFTLVGLIVVSRTKTVNGYFIMLVPFVIVIFLPVAAYVPFLAGNAFLTNPVFSFFPTSAALTLIDGACFGMTTGRAITSVITLALWTAPAYIIARAYFTRYIILRVGGEE